MALAHGQETALLGLTLVLLAPALATADLEHHALVRNVQRVGQGRQCRPQTRLRLVRVDRGRRLVFLHVQPVAVGGAIDVDGQRVFGDVGVVDAITVDIAALEPFG